MPTRHPSHSGPRRDRSLETPGATHTCRQHGLVFLMLTRPAGRLWGRQDGCSSEKHLPTPGPQNELAVTRAGSQGRQDDVREKRGTGPRQRGTSGWTHTLH